MRERYTTCDGAPLPVFMEDAPLHTSDHPFCADPACPCHEDDELFAEFVEQPICDGLLTTFEASRLLCNETV